MIRNKSRNFKYFQPNNKDTKDKFGDCVVRALCKVFDKSWLETYDILVKKGRELQDMPDDKPVYEAVLKEMGFVYTGISNKKGSKRPLVKQFAKKEKRATVMVVANHLVACQDGYFYDMWDCGNKAMYGYWTKGEEK